MRRRCERRGPRWRGRQRLHAEATGIGVLPALFHHPAEAAREQGGCRNPEPARRFRYPSACPPMVSDSALEALGGVQTADVLNIRLLLPEMRQAREIGDFAMYVYTPCQHGAPPAI